MSLRTREVSLAVTFVFILLLIFINVPFGSCISCVQCQGDSTGEVQEVEEEVHTCIGNPPSATACPDGMNYCLTVTTNQPARGLVTVIRSCAPVDMYWDCEIGTQAGLPVQVCHSTCSTDNCNNASAAGTSPSILVLLALAVSSTIVSQ